MWVDIITAYLFIVLAELGDKSQLLAMSLATKYRTRTVILGVFIGVVINHVIAILFGNLLQQFLTADWRAVIVGLIFLSFGLLSMLEHPHQSALKSYRYPAIITVAMLFFFGELGDKTQFATMALSLEMNRPWMLLLGTVPAMLTTSILAIWIGKQLGQRVPELTLRMFSSFVFISYGAVRLGQFLYPISLILFTLFIFGVILITWLLSRRSRTLTTHTISAFKEAAQTLHEYYSSMTNQMETICLSESVCGVCQQEGCILGHIKYLIEEGKQGRPVSMAHLRSKAMRQLDQKKLDQALKITIQELENNWQDAGYQTLHQIRQNIEFIRYKKSLRSTTYEAYLHDISLLQKKTKSE